jgi:hypothetical protein
MQCSLKGHGEIRQFNNPVPSTSRLDEVKAKITCVNLQDPVFHNHGSQHRVNVWTHLTPSKIALWAYSLCHSGSNLNTNNACSIKDDSC